MQNDSYSQVAFDLLDAITSVSATMILADRVGEAFGEEVAAKLLRECLRSMAETSSDAIGRMRALGDAEDAERYAEELVADE